MTGYGNSSKLRQSTRIKAIVHTATTSYRYRRWIPEDAGRVECGRLREARLWLCFVSPVLRLLARSLEFGFGLVQVSFMVT